MRLAVIDCGTNTFNLLIADTGGKNIRRVFSTKRAVKLGSQGIKDGIIGPQPFNRTLKALSGYKKITSRYAVEKVLVTGTAALRDAKNGKQLIREVKKETGFDIRLISGNDEAGYIYEGVKQALDLGDHTSMIVDIGGGSVEFIICNGQKIFWKRSFRIGGARLLEIIKPGDPITKSETEALNKFLCDSLDPLIKASAKFKPGRLIGSSGTFDTLAAMILHKTGEQNQMAGKTHYQFKLSEFRKLHSKLVRSTYSERLKMPGMLRMRADMIVPASILISFVLRETGIRNLHLSTYALKEGILSEYLKKIKR